MFLITVLRREKSFLIIFACSFQLMHQLFSNWINHIDAENVAIVSSDWKFYYVTENVEIKKITSAKIDIWNIFNVDFHI